MTGASVRANRRIVGRRNRKKTQLAEALRPPLFYSRRSISKVVEFGKHESRIQSVGIIF